MINRFTKSKTALLAALAAASMALTACGGAAKTAPSSSAAETAAAPGSETGASTTAAAPAESAAKSDAPSNEKLTHVTVSEFRGLNWSSAYLADALGYFTEEGLDVEFKIYKDGPVAFQGMHAGDSDFCLLSTEPVLKAQDSGFESVLVLTNTDMRGYAFATQPEIKTIADLKGKTVFAGMPGSAPYSFVLSLLSDAGLSENDVSFINLEYGALVNALAAKQIDGSFFDVYQRAEIQAAVPGINIQIDATNPETHKQLYGSEYCQTTIVTCTKAFADKNPETVQKFVNASVKALNWMSKNKVETIAHTLAPYFEGMDEAVLVSKLETILPTFSATGIINPEGYGTVEKFCVDQGLIQAPIGYDVMVRPDFAEKAAEALKSK